jgi:phosphatidylinositol alpha-1,6-mannosyltransferase
VDGETGVLVDGRDGRAVAAAVGELLADPGLARAMGDAGRARVERDHDWTAVAGTLAGWLRLATG